jgi:hypothetical protein
VKLLSFFSISIFSSVHFIDELTNGLVSKPMAKFDAKLTEELTNHLFEEKGKQFSGQFFNIFQ